MKYALDAIEDPTLPRARPPRADLADDRHHRVRALRRHRRLARRVPGLRQGGVARRSCPSSTRSSTTRSRSTARGSRRCSRARCRSRSRGYARDGRLAELPPILTFQSVVDFTVSTRAIVTALYAHLPANGSELVLFDLNRSAKFGPLLRARAPTRVLDRLLPDPPRALPHRRSSPTPSPDSRDVVERVIEAGARRRAVRAPLGLAYPRDVFSLSHVALPFPLDDCALRPAARPDRRLRRQPRRDGAARRARHADRQPRLADPHVVEPVLPVHARAHRGRDRPSRRPGRHGAEVVRARGRRNGAPRRSSPACARQRRLVAVQHSSW